MSSILNSVAKEPITPQKIMTLPLIDSNDEISTIPVKTEKEAREILIDIRGF